MREIQRRTDQVPPIDIHFILVGNRRRKNGYQRFSPQSLRESVLDSIGSRTHLIIVESTGLRACSVQKGSLIFRLIIKGRSHNPAFPWLGENPWDMLIRFEEKLSRTMKPKHTIYPVEVGKAPPMTLSSFLIGYPTMTPLRVEYHQPYLFGEQSSIEAEYYVCIPPEFLCKVFKEKLTVTVDEIARSSGCEATASVVYEEEPFREDARSVIVKATSSTFLRLTGFEPIFEWLPYPVSAKDLKSSGFANDIVVLGPGDWTMSTAQDEKTVIAEALRASEIFAEIPYEAALLQEKR
jgi:acetylornithine deacetylase/succinyl-diaminopimelate desuccinylase-like protein